MVVVFEMKIRIVVVQQGVHMVETLVSKRGYYGSSN